MGFLSFSANRNFDTVVVGQTTATNADSCAFLGNSLNEKSIPGTDSKYSVAVGSNMLTVAGRFVDSVAIGYRVGYLMTDDMVNTVAIGSQTLQSSAGGTSLNTVAVGAQALTNVTTGVRNTAVGAFSGSTITTGSGNTILGRFSGSSVDVDIRTLSNNVVLSDGNGEVKLWADSSRNVFTYPQQIPPTLSRPRQMVFNLTSDTNLRISVRGTDGITRVANITLA